MWARLPKISGPRLYSGGQSVKHRNINPTYYPQLIVGYIRIEFQLWINLETLANPYFQTIVLLYLHLLPSLNWITLLWQKTSWWFTVSFIVRQVSFLSGPQSFILLLSGPLSCRLPALTSCISPVRLCWMHFIGFLVPLSVCCSCSEWWHELYPTATKVMSSTYSLAILRSIVDKAIFIGCGKLLTLSFSLTRADASNWFVS